MAAIVGAVTALSLGDALIKSLGSDLPLFQLFALRFLPIALVLAGFLRLRRPGVRLLPRAPGWAMLRSLLLTIMWAVYYLALYQMELSLAAAIYYTAPLFILLFAGPILGERPSALAWAAVALGFCGVLVLLRPGGGAFGWAALLPFVSSVTYALAMVITRKHCQGEDPAAVALHLHLVFVGFGVLGALLWPLVSPDAVVWVPVGPREAVAVAALALAALIGSVLAVVAYQVAPAGLVAPFDYAYLVCATLWGVIFFAERLEALALLGMAMIALGGILATRANRS
ncbi:membrane protein [Candidatus Rhodobacter oscarellae]|uniref:Membrane protein n=1 Tax=Candidatus Rhodobacter oscarellae TaxID=1675527 RepID=A0A0J9E5Z4_9RHOB|nr:membrane protein [Candidatus Rhodobacter lobularis]